MANVLVIRFSYFGDVAMLVPVVYSAAKAYPDHTFFVLTSKGYETLFDVGLPNVQVIGVKLSDYKGFGGMWKLSRELKKYRINAVADMNNVLRSIVLRTILFLSGKKVRSIDKGKAEKEQLTSHKKPLKQLKTTFERYADVFSSLGLHAENSFTSYFDVNKKNREFISDTIPFDASKKNIGIAPFAKHTQKTYPPEKMEELITVLAAKPDTMIYLFGGKDDAVTFSGWEKVRNNVFSLATKTNLQTELQLMANLDVMISMDSANMHLASLVGTPVVSVWGGTHPYLGFYGFNQSEDNAVQIDLDCRPCSVTGVKPCWRKDLACLYGISPEDIISKVEKYMS